MVKNALPIFLYGTNLPILSDFYAIILLYTGGTRPKQNGDSEGNSMMGKNAKRPKSTASVTTVRIDIHVPGIQIFYVDLCSACLKY